MGDHWPNLEESLGASDTEIHSSCSYEEDQTMESVADIGLFLDISYVSGGVGKLGTRVLTTSYSIPI